MNTRNAPLEIGEVQSLLGLTKRAIRLYEDEGLIAPGRSAHNHRVFDRRDLARLAIVARLRAAGLSLRDIRCVLKLRDHREGAQKASSFASLKLDEEAHRLKTRLALIEQARLTLPALEAPAEDHWRFAAE